MTEIVCQQCGSHHIVTSYQPDGDHHKCVDCQHTWFYPKEKDFMDMYSSTSIRSDD
jgi:hypothetical protein